MSTLKKLTGGVGEPSLSTNNVADFFKSRQDTRASEFKNSQILIQSLNNTDMEQYLYTKKIQALYPHEDIRFALSSLLDGVKVGVDKPLTEIMGQDVNGLRARKRFAPGEKIGIYGGVILGDSRDNSYLLGITHASGNYVIDGTPSIDRWTIFSYANEWIWDTDRNNAQCLSGGILTAIKTINSNESIYWNYGEDYPWWPVILPLFHHIPWHLNKVAKFLNITIYDDDIRSLMEVVSSVDESTFQGLLTHPDCMFIYALAVYSCGHEPREKNLSASYKSTRNILRKAHCFQGIPDGIIMKLEHLAHNDVIYSDKCANFVEWTIRVLYHVESFNKLVFRYADNPNAPLVEKIINPTGRDKRRSQRDPLYIRTHVDVIAEGWNCDLQSNIDKRNEKRRDRSEMRSTAHPYSKLEYVFPDHDELLQHFLRVDSSKEASVKDPHISKVVYDILTSRDGYPVESEKMTDTQDDQDSPGINPTLNELDITANIDESCIASLINDVMDFSSGSNQFKALYMEDTYFDESESINHLPCVSYDEVVLSQRVGRDGDSSSINLAIPLNALEPVQRTSPTYRKMLELGTAYNTTTNNGCASIPLKTYRFSGSADRGNLSIRVHFREDEKDIEFLKNMFHRWTNNSLMDPEVELVSLKFCLEIANPRRPNNARLDLYGWYTLLDTQYDTKTGPHNLVERIDYISKGAIDSQEILHAYSLKDQDLKYMIPTEELNLLCLTNHVSTWVHTSKALSRVSGNSTITHGSYFSLGDMRSICSQAHLLYFSMPTTATNIESIGYMRLNDNYINYADVSQAIENVYYKIIAMFHKMSLLSPADSIPNGPTVDMINSQHLEQLKGPLPSTSKKKRRLSGVPPLRNDSPKLRGKIASDLVVLHYNGGHVSRLKLGHVLEDALSKGADVIMITDAGVTPGPTDHLVSHARSILSGHVSSWGMHSIRTIHPPVKSLNKHPPGGALFIYNLSRISKPNFKEIIPYGILDLMTFNFGTVKVRILSTYFPPRARAGAGPMSIESQIKGLGHVNDSAIEYCFRVLSDEIAMSSSIEGVTMIGGDFNSNTLSTDHYGIEKYMADHGLTNCSNEREKILPSFSRSLGLSVQYSRIDNVYMAPCEGVQVLSCYPCQPKEILHDHYLMYTHIRVLGVEKCLFGSRLKRNLRKDIHSSDITAMAAFTEAMESEELPQSLIDGDEELFIDYITNLSGRLASKLSKARHSRKCPNFTSAVSNVILIHLRMSVIIRRHVWFPSKRHAREDKHKLWSEANYKVNIGRVLHQLNKVLAKIPMTDEDLSELNVVLKFSTEYWNTCTLTKLTYEADDVYAHFRRCLSSRHMKEWRARFVKVRIEMEKALSARKPGAAHRYHKPFEDKSFTMEEQIVDGEMVTDPSLVHEHIMNYYRDALSFNKDIPDDSLCGKSCKSWQDLDLDREPFLMKTSPLGIPEDVAGSLWKAFEKRPVTDAMISFQQSVMITPTLEEFILSIKVRPNDSAGSVSGCTYNQIKNWPQSIVEMMYKRLAKMFEQRISPKSWKSRFLVLLKKVPNPTLAQTRPLMLYEALRKVWWGIFMNRIQIYLKDSGVLCQDQTAYLYGKDTSIGSMHILNALETLQEFQSELFMSSWDFKTAFDSVTRPLLVYGGVRVGIPSELMNMMVELDIGGLTILRSPAALEVLNNTGNFRNRLCDLGFSAEIGTGQGGVEGPLSWDFVIDILLVALRDVGLKDHFWTRDLQGVNRPTRDQTFADDILSMCATQEALQSKCNLVCAFSMLTGIRISREKFRCFHIQNNNAMRPKQLDFLTVRTRTWTNTDVVFFQTAGDLKHLGVLYDIAMENDNQYLKAKSQLESCCTYTSSRHSSSEAKLTHTGRSTLMQLAYYSKYMNWPKNQWDKLETILNTHYKKVTFNLQSFPNKLLNVSRRHGGLGLQSFSDLVNDNKLRILFAMMNNSRETNHDITSMIGRSMSSSGIHCSASTRCMVMDSFDMVNERWWSTSLIQYLSSADIGLEKNGVDIDYDTDRAVDSPNEDDRRILWASGIYSIGELYLVGDSPEIFKVLRLSSDIREHVLSHPTSLGHITIRPGQVWGYENCPSLIEILGFTLDDSGGNSHSAHVIYWKRYPSKLNQKLSTGQKVFLRDDEAGQSYCSGSGSRESARLSDIIAAYYLLISLTKERPIESSNKINLIGTTTSSISSIKKRIGRPPKLLSSLKSKIPSDIIKGAGNMDRAVTDGSYTKHESTADFLLGTSRVSAGGAVICYNEAGDSFRIKIKCEEPLTKSAYNPELYSLALATVLANTSIYKPEEIELYSDCVSAINSVKRSLTGHFKYSPLMWPLLGISRSTLPRIEHVRGHPERRLHHTLWSWKDCGIALADRVAGDKLPPEATISDHMVVDIITSSLPLRLVHINEWYEIPGSLALKTDESLPDDEVIRRRRLLLTDVKDMISLKRRGLYLHQRDTIHSTSVTAGVLDNVGPTAELQQNKFSWLSSSNSLAVMMYDMKKIKISTHARNTRLVYDKHYEMNRGKREGIPNECPLCGASNLDAAHVINTCSHGLVSYTRFEGRNDFNNAVALAVDEDFHELEAINYIIKNNPLGYHLQHGIVPGELSEIIRQDKRLSNPHTGRRKSFFNRGMRLLGSASVKTTSMFIMSMNKESSKPMNSTSHLNSIVRHTRLMKGGLPVFKRNKQKPVLYMSQFKQPPAVADMETIETMTLETTPLVTKNIHIRVINTSETIVVDLVVRYCGELLEMATAYTLDLIIDPVSSLPKTYHEIGMTLKMKPMQRTSSLLLCDPGFSGYLLLYALHNEGIFLNMMTAKDRSTLRSFVTGISGNAGSEVNRQEFVITADYLKNNPFTMSMPKTSCLWLLPTDIMLIDDAPRCIFWEPTSVKGDVIKTVIGIDTADLKDIRILPHVVIDNSSYSFLSLPHGMDPDKIIDAIDGCSRQLLEDVVLGVEKDHYLSTFSDDFV